MRRRGVLLAVLLLAAAVWGGLPRGRELGDMALLRTLGVDLEGEDYVVTASTGRRARGLQGEETLEPMVLSARGATLSGALAAMESLSEQELFFGYVDQLLLGESLAEGAPCRCWSASSGTASWALGPSCGWSGGRPGRR